jgi:atypical dual specificity phosphatase
MSRIGNTYRWFRGKFADRPANFSWVIDRELAGSGMPVNLSQLLWVANSGIRTIVTIRETPLPTAWLANSGHSIEYLHVEVADFCAPSLERLETTVDYINLRLKEKKPVMVHCAAGKGRTGTILAAFIIKQDRNLTSLEAIKKIRDLRPGSVQSEEQVESLLSFEKHLRKSVDS